MRIHIPNYKSRDYLVVPSSASADWKVRNISPSPLSIKNHKVDTPFNGTRFMWSELTKWKAPLLVLIPIPAFWLLFWKLIFSRNTFCHLSLFQGMGTVGLWVVGYRVIPIGPTRPTTSSWVKASDSASAIEDSFFPPSEEVAEPIDR